MSSQSTFDCKVSFQAFKFSNVIFVLILKSLFNHNTIYSRYSVLIVWCKSTNVVIKKLYDHKIRNLDLWPLIYLILFLFQLDMLFARLALPQIADDIDLRSESLLKNLHEKCVRSLNGMMYFYFQYNWKLALQYVYCYL